MKGTADNRMTLDRLAEMVQEGFRDTEERVISLLRKEIGEEAGGLRAEMRTGFEKVSARFDGIDSHLDGIDRRMDHHADYYVSWTAHAALSERVEKLEKRK